MTNSETIFHEDLEQISNSLTNYYDKIQGKNILIAGGKGFLGTYFVHSLRLSKNTPL